MARALTVLPIDRRRSILARIVLVIFAGVLAAGCTAHSSSVRSTGRAGALRLASTDAAAPATASRQVDRSAIVLPAGSVLEIGTPPPSLTSNAPGEITYTPVRATLAAPAELVTERTRDELATATGHAPPSPADIARGKGVRAFWLAGLACLVMAGLLVWRGHILAAVCAGAAGLALPVLANVLSSGIATTAGVGLLAAAGAFFAAWHIIRSRLISAEPMTSGK